MQLATPPLYMLKASGEGIVEGIASSFGNVDSYGDSIAPGAFMASLAEHQSKGTAPSMLWSHRTAEPIGKWVGMSETSRGLHVRGQLNLRTTRGEQAFEHLRGGDIGGLSIGYSVAPNGDEMRSDGVRVLKAVQLHEISVVSLPADQSARVSSVKSYDDAPQTLREFERVLHQLGYSKTRAALLAKRGWTADEPDPDEPLDLPKLQAVAAQLHSFTLALKGTP